MTSNPPLSAGRWTKVTLQDPTPLWSSFLSMVRRQLLSLQWFLLVFSPVSVLSQTHIKYSQPLKDLRLFGFWAFQCPSRILSLGLPCGRQWLSVHSLSELCWARAVGFLCHEQIILRRCCSKRYEHQQVQFCTKRSVTEKTCPHVGADTLSNAGAMRPAWVETLWLLLWWSLSLASSKH